MIRLEIQREGRPPHVQEIAPGVYPIGADEENAIILPGPDVAGRHAILIVRHDGAWVEDLNSSSGTIVGGRSVSGRSEVPDGQTFLMGSYALTLHADAPPSPAPETRRIPVAPPAPAPAPPPPPSPMPPGADAAARRFLEEKQAIKLQIHRDLLERLDIKRLTASRVDEVELHKRVLKTLNGIVKDREHQFPPHVQAEGLTKEIYDEAVGLGPLEDLLADATVTEIMVNGASQIYVERDGKIELTDRAFLDERSVLAIIERIVSPLGRRIDESQPYVDARLRDGSRVNAIIPPLSLTGPCVTIRKFSKIPLTDRDLVRMGTLNEFMADFLRACVLLRKNIVVSGGTGSGKTTLLNVLSSYLPDTDRIITIEDAAELQLKQTHIVRLEARPPNIEGKGGIAIRDLVRNALRMRPDRIVVGECRGGESLDMLQAMNTGHDGSLTTVHSNSPRDVISRLETMVLMSGMDLPVRAVREQIAAAIDLIIHIARLSDGSRRIVNITEVVGIEGERTTMQEIFLFKQTGLAPGGRVQGRFLPTGAVPTFIEDAQIKGISINRAMFDPQKWEA